MESAKTTEKRSLIVKETEFINQYVQGFTSYSAKDEAAIGEILTMLTKVHHEIGRIEDAHQKRIVLMNEMLKTVKAMEDDHQQFAEKHKKVARKAPS